MTSSRLIRALALASFAVLLSSPSAAQRDQPAAPGVVRAGWLPRSSRLGPELTPAERATILNRMNEIERLLLQIPELARPDGFEVWPSVSASAHEIWPVIQGHPQGNYVVQSYRLMAFRPSREIAGEGLACLEIVVNPLPGQVAYIDPINDLEDGKGDWLYIEHPFGAKKPGALLAYGQRLRDLDEDVPAPGAVGFSPTNYGTYAVFFSANGISPWLEVTRQEYLEALIWNGETRDLADIERIRRARTKTRYELWMEEASKRKREREEIFAQLEKADPAQAAAARKEAEAIEREITEQLKAAEPEDRAANAEVLANGMPADLLREQLAAMHADERAQSAWTMGTGSVEFFAPGAPEAVRIVRANPGFYGSAHPRIAPRGVIVRFIANLTCHAADVQRAFYSVYQNLDYAALRRLLETEPR